MNALHSLLAKSHLIRVISVALVLCTLLFAGSLVYQRTTAHACGSYKLSGSHVDFSYNAPTGDYVHVYFELWYNSCNSTNYAHMYAYSGGSYIILEVTRFSGPDGGQVSYNNLNCPYTGSCNTPAVYSPNNKAQAWIYTGDGIVVYGDSF
jgi:hypothetical protein